MTDTITPDTIDTPDVPIQRKSDKRERKQTARLLPPGITQNMMKKYVVYYREMTYNKDGKPQPREYFKVESHPRLNKPWTTSKSTKISLIEKLNDANQMVADLENKYDNNDNDNNYNNDNNDKDKETKAISSTESLTSIVERWTKQLPKYTSLRIVRNTDTAIILSAIYDRKDNVNAFRWTCSHTFSLPLPLPLTESAANYDTSISLAIHKLREKLQDKYALDVLMS